MAARLVVATRSGIAVADEAAGWAVRLALAGGDVRALAADPARPQRLYAGTQGDGVFRSDDGGSSWTGAGLAGEIVKALAVDRDARVLAATKPPALFVSESGGASWSELPALRRMRRWYWWQPAERPHTPYVTAIAVSPARPDTLLVSIEAQRILRSEDGGRSWTRLRRGTAFDAHAVTFHPLDAYRAYEGAGAGAATSRDGGRTWERASDGLRPRYVMTIADDPADAGLWYAAAAPVRAAHTANSRACILRRDGTTWTRLSGGLPLELEHLPHALACPVPDTVYAGLRDGAIWRTLDRGESWARLPVELDGVRALVVIDAGRARDSG